MPLEAGSVFVRIAGLFDKTQFDKADQAVAAQRAQAKDPITYTIGIDNSKIAKEGAAARATVDAETKKPVDIPVGLDTKALTAEVAAAREEVKRGIGSPNSGSGDPFTLSLSDTDRSLLKSFVDGKGHGVSDPLRRHESGRSGGDSDALTVGKFIEGMLHTPGGFMGMGKFGLGSMIGLGPEHAITAGASMLGTLGPAAAGGGLIAAGAAGKEVIGGGADALVGHETRSNIEAIYKDMTALDAVQQQYGKNSKEAAAAQKTFNSQLDALGSGPGIKAEEGVAEQVKTLVKTFKDGSSEAQAESAGMMSQVVTLAQKYLPMVIAAATKNLGIVDKQIKPLFAWLEGPQGKGIFTSLENDFSRELPTSIHMFTQAIELALKLIKDAAAEGGGMSKALNGFFTKENERSADSLDGTVKKLIGDFHMWVKLVEAFGKVFAGVMHDSAHEGDGLVKGLTSVLDKMAAWENSAKGSSELHSFFEGRKSELDAILKTFDPLLKVFFQFYMDVQKLVPGVTEIFKVLTAILTPISNLAGHSKLFNDMFVVPMGLFLLVWKRFGWEKAVGLVRNLATGFGLLGTNTRKAADAQKAFNDENGVKGAESDAEGDSGGLLSRIKGRFRGAASEATGGIVHLTGGATGMGAPGTKTNPWVVTEIDPKYSGMGEEAKGYDEEMEGDAGKSAEQGVIPGLERDASQTGLTGFEDAAAAGAVPAGMMAKKGAKDTEDAAKDGGGILSKLKSLLSGGAGDAGKAAGVAGDAGEAGEVAGVAGAATEGGGLVAGLGGIAAVAAPIAAVAAAIAGIAKATGTLGNLTKQVVTPFKDAWKSVTDTVSNGSGFKDLENDVKDASQWLDKLFASPQFKADVIFFEDEIGAAAKLIATVLVVAFKSGITIIDDTIKSLVDAVKSIADVFSGVFNVIKGLITGNVSEIKKGFGQIGEGMLEGLKSVIVGIPDMVIGVFKDVVSGVLSFLGISSPSTVFASIGKSIVDGLMSELDEIPKLALKLGEDLVNGMVSGVKSLGSKVGGAIKSGVSSITHTAEHDLDPKNWERGGKLPGFARGGRVPGREFGLGDRMTLVDPLGRPRARMAGDESVYTRHQRPYVDAGLRKIGFGGSNDLWNRVRTPHSYSGGGSLPYGVDPIQTFATGGTIKPSTDKRTMTASGLTTNATLSKFGQGALNSVDNQVAALDNKYTQQSNVFDLYSDGGDGDLSVKDLNILMKIREQQWDLLYKEWLTLPAALKSLQQQTYGVGKKGHKTGGIRNTVNDLKTDINSLQTLVTDIGSDTKPSTDSGSQAYEKLESYYKGQTPTSIADTARSNQQIQQANASTRSANAKDQATINKQSSSADANIPNGPSASSMNAVYKSNAAQMATYTSQLTQIHKTSLTLTKQIASLIPQSQQATGKKKSELRKQINALRAQRVTNNDKATSVAGQLSDMQNTNETIAIQWKDASYYNRMARAASETGLTGKTAELEIVLKQLETALSNEEKLESEAVSAIASIKSKVSGDGSDGESTVDQLGDYGYDIMDLNQQGAKVPESYQQEIDKVFKALGIKLPANWASAAATAQATQGEQSMQAFQQSLSSTFGSFGSNFVSAGANPYKGKAGKFAGNANYGAASGQGQTVHARGGEVGATPYGGTSEGKKTEINITQHFGGPPPDPHTYSHGLNYELQSAIG